MIALAFANNSAKNLILASRSLPKLEAAKSDILKINNSCLNVLVVCVDTTSETDVQKLERVVKDNFGHADVLVNNSGQWAGRGNIEELDVKAWWNDFVRPFLSLPNYPILPPPPLKDLQWLNHNRRFNSGQLHFPRKKQLRPHKICPQPVQRVYRA